MNLVTVLLEKRYNAAVQIAKKERDPFSPLFETVQSKIKQLSQEKMAMKEKQYREVMVEEMTEEELRLAADGFDDCCGSGSGSGSEVGDDGLGRIQSCLGLWMVLGASLESVLGS